MGRRVCLTSASDRERARRIRNRQWRLLERMAEHDPLFVCHWNRERRPALEDEVRHGLLTSLDVYPWFEKVHPDWIEVGEWNAERRAYPYRLTAAGREALRDRHLYDSEPVIGGLVEPGWSCVPAR